MRDQHIGSACVIRLNEVQRRTGLSRSSVYNLLNARSKYYDPNFPRPRKIGKRAIGFIESEIDDWISSLAKNCSSALPL